MLSMCSRRSLLKFVGAMLPLKPIDLSAVMLGFESGNNESSWQPIADTFPSHPPELAREVVTVAHFNLKRVKELVDARPALARASWDWVLATGRQRWGQPLTWGIERSLNT